MVCVWGVTTEERTSGCEVLAADGGWLMERLSLPESQSGANVLSD